MFKKSPPKTQRQERGQVSMYGFQYPFLQTLWRNHFFSTTLILTTSFQCLLGHWKVWRRKVKHKWNFCSFILRQQLRLSWPSSWRNLLNVIIDESTQGLKWVKMIVITKVEPQLNSYRYKKSIIWSSRISGTFLPFFTCVWFQQCKIWSQLNQILFVTHSC